METTWMAQLTERERKEVEFCQQYAQNFNHGTDGHSRMLVVARLADLLDTLTRSLPDRTDPLPQQEQSE